MDLAPQAFFRNSVCLYADGVVRTCPIASDQFAVLRDVQGEEPGRGQDARHTGL